MHHRSAYTRRYTLYSPNGVFQPTALLSYIALFKPYDTPQFLEFTEVRSKFQEFLIAHRNNITEAVRKLGSGARSRPRLIALYQSMITQFRDGRSSTEVYSNLAKSNDFAFLFAELPSVDSVAQEGRRFSREVRGATYLRDVIPTAVRCMTCKGLLHRKGMQTGHAVPRRDSGEALLDNAILQHPFCNSTAMQ
jgi:hypothetical protein